MLNTELERELKQITGNTSSNEPGRFDYINDQLAAIVSPTYATVMELLYIGSEPLARIGFGIVNPGAQLQTKEKSRSYGRLIFPFSTHVLWKDAYNNPEIIALEMRKLHSLQKSGARLLNQSPTGVQYFKDRITDPDFEFKKFSIVVGDDNSRTTLLMLAESFGINLAEAQRLLTSG